jgi:hypothetical protein
VRFGRSFFGKLEEEEVEEEEEEEEEEACKLCAGGSHGVESCSYGRTYRHGTFHHLFQSLCE